MFWRSHRELSASEADEKVTWKKDWQQLRFFATDYTVTRHLPGNTIDPSKGIPDDGQPMTWGGVRKYDSSRLAEISRDGVDTGIIEGRAALAQGSIMAIDFPDPSSGLTKTDINPREINEVVFKLRGADGPTRGWMSCDEDEGPLVLKVALFVGRQEMIEFLRDLRGTGKPELFLSIHALLFQYDEGRFWDENSSNAFIVPAGGDRGNPAILDTLWFNVV